jgi:hypothetical protein
MRLIGLIPVMLLLTSCEPAPLHLKVAQVGSALIAEVYEKWWFGLRSSDVPCVHDVTLTRDADAQVLWRMVVDPERQCSDIEKFVIGRAPPGFRDEVRMRAELAAGDYTLTADGIGQGRREFTLPLGH